MSVKTTFAKVTCVAAVFAASACGTLVDDHNSGAPSNDTSITGGSATAGAEPGLGGPQSTAAPNSSAATGAVLPSSVGGATGTSTAVTARPVGGSRDTTKPSAASSSKATNASIPSAGQSGLGFTPTTINLGFSLPDSSGNQIYSSAGGSGVDQADLPTAVKAIVAYVNAHGGIAGRKINPIFKLHSSAESDSSTAYAADCQSFTTDNKVFAAYSADGSAATIHELADCLAQHKTVLMLQTDTAWDQTDFTDDAPYVYSPSYLRGDRWPAVIDALIGLNYFDPSYKLGLVSIDEPSAQRLLNGTVIPTLKARGIKVTDSASASTFSDFAGLGKLAADTANIAVRFKAEGIDHVMFVGTYTSVSYFFPKAADGQKYYPRYAVTTVEAPQALTTNESAAQMHRAVGVGWNVGLDVADAQDPGDNPRFKQCLDIATKAGVSIPDRPGAYGIAAICDAIDFLQAALARATTLSPAGMAVAVGNLGTSYLSTQTHDTFFSPGHYDGVGSVRGLLYDDACTCFKYTGPYIPVH